jgi:transcriptional regulator with XRE-family HTH domain
MKLKEQTAGQRIERIRGDRTQAEFGALLGGASQSAVSAWERDDKDRAPSSAIYFRLAALADDPDDVGFFLEQGGVPSEAVISVADALLKKGEVKMDAILGTAEEKLKDQMADQRQMADEGKVVLAQPFADEDATGQQAPLLIPVPAFLVPHRASARYKIAPGPPAFEGVRRGFSPGDILVFDTFKKREIDTSIGEELVAQVKHRRGSLPGGLFLGRLFHVYEHGKRNTIFGAADRPEASRGDLAGLSLRLVPDLEANYEKHPHSGEWLPPHDHYLYSDFEILGAFITRFSSGTMELWKQRARGQG